MSSGNDDLLSTMVPGSDENDVTAREDETVGRNLNDQLVIARMKVEQNNSDDDDIQNKTPEDDENQPLIRMKRPRSNAWSFFERVPGSTSTTGKSVCKACGVELSCNDGSTTSMRAHLRGKHPDLFKTMNEMDADSSCVSPSKVARHLEAENSSFTRLRKPRSNVWSFFYRLPGLNVGTGKAVCLTCNMELSCNDGSTTSMRYHLRHKHRDLFQTMNEMDDQRKSSTLPQSYFQTVRSSNDDDLLRKAVWDSWNSKLYSDVDVCCGEDSGVVRTHRLYLAALSPFLREVLLSDDCAHEDFSLMLPDVSSGVLTEFLENICSGRNDVADVDPSLSHLGFGQFSLDSNYIEVESPPSSSYVTPVKCEPEPYSCLEPIADLPEEEYVQEFYGHEENPDDDDPDYNGDENKRKTRRQLRKRKKRSLAWRYFDKIDGTIAVCKTCQVVVKTEKGNTSGMQGHLRTAHPEQFVDLRSSREANESFEGGVVEDGEKDVKVVAQQDVLEPFEWNRPKRKKRSLVWNYFEQLDGHTAICTTCNAAIKTETGNTTGMANHLKGTHPKLYQELQESRVEKKEQQSFGDQHQQQEQQLEDIPEVDSDDENSIVKNEMNEVMVQSSPVWQFYEPDDDENQVKCIECDKVLRKVSGSTTLLIRHLIRHHEELYDSCIKDKLENPDLPDPGDNAHPIWQFFDNIALDNSTANEENVGSARCKDCLGLFPFPDTDVEPLEEHLRSEHRPNLDSYENLCEEWRQQRLEEAAIAQKSMKVSSEVGEREKRKTGPRTTRSAVWNYFEKTSDKTKNVCMKCGKVLVCNQQNTTNMIRHLECNHHDLFVQFLKDSGSAEDNIKGASEDKTRKRRGPKPTYSDDPVHRTCPECHKVYSCRPAMLYHRKTVHSGVRPYKCDECGMTFSRPDSYRGHTHSKVRTYLCSHCGKTFARKNIRDQHERAHRGDKRYVCGFCGKNFMTNQQKVNHERTHTGEKPYQCNECGRQFAQQHQLTTHMRIHTGEKPYSCPHCGQKFRHLSSRNNHKCETRVGTAAIRWTEPQEHQEHHVLLGAD